MGVHGAVLVWGAATLEGRAALFDTLGVHDKGQTVEGALRDPAMGDGGLACQGRTVGGLVPRPVRLAYGHHSSMIQTMPQGGPGSYENSEG